MRANDALFDQTPVIFPSAARIGAEKFSVSPLLRYTEAVSASSSTSLVNAVPVGICPLMHCSNQSCPLTLWPTSRPVSSGFTVKRHSIAGHDFSFCVCYDHQVITTIGFRVEICCGSYLFRCLLSHRIEGEGLKHAPNRSKRFLSILSATSSAINCIR